MNKIYNTKEQVENIKISYEISELLAISNNIYVYTKKLIDILSKKKNIEYGVVTIFDRKTKKTESIKFYSDSKEIKKNIIEKVISSGEIIVIPSTSNFFYICIPLKTGKEIVGSLSFFKFYSKGLDKSANKDIESIVEICEIVAKSIFHIHKYEKILEKLKHENLNLKRELSGKNKIENIIGNSSSIQETCEVIHRAIDTDAIVLLRGEPGTGRTLIARTLHYNGQRKKEPFIVANCSIIPNKILEYELFGLSENHIVEKKGLIEQAEGGTLYINEIGKMDIPIQKKILLFIQEKSFQRFGSKKKVISDTRLILSTSEDLESAVKEKRFKEDLYYRLNVFPIYIPPLRERRTDIILIAEYFLEKLSKQKGKKIFRISTSAIDMLMQYHWPGNVSELESCIQRAISICQSDTIKSIHLPPTLQTANISKKKNNISFNDAVENFEKELIVEGLKKNNGNQTKTAKELDTSLRIINYKIHQYDINPKDYKL